MCCFTRPVQDVSDTKIFVRLGNGVTQFIAYAMSMSAKEDLAMVLPIPVAKGIGEDAVRFISLEHYPALFGDLWSGFPAPQTYGPASKGVAAVQPTLKVHSVGSYDASFVPTIGRLKTSWEQPAHASASSVSSSNKLPMSSTNTRQHCDATGRKPT